VTDRSDKSDRQPSLLAAESVRKRRRRRRLGSVRKLETGRYEVRARIVLPDGAKHIVRRTCDEAHLEEVRAAVLNEARELRDGLKRPNTRITLGEYQARFARSRSWNAERKSTFKTLAPFHETPLHAITLEVVSAWATRLAKKKSQGYIRHAFELLRMMLLHAQQAGVLARVAVPSKVPGVHSHKTAFKRRRPMQPAEVAALFKAADVRGGDLGLRLRVLLQTGARPSEIARARRDWLRDARGVDYLGVPPGSGLLDLPPAKNGDPHTAPLPPSLYRALLEHFHALPVAAQRTGLLFPVLRTTVWAQREQLVTQRQWSEIRAAAGVDPTLVLYQLKHTRLSAVTNDPRLGARAAQTLVGHTDVRTTLVYATKEHLRSGAAFEEMPGTAPHAPFPATSAQPEPPDDEPSPPKNPVGPPSLTRKTPASRSIKPNPRTSRAKTRASARSQERDTAPEVKCSSPTPVEPPELPLVIVALAKARDEGFAATLATLLEALGPLDCMRCCQELLDVAVDSNLSSEDVQTANALLLASREHARPLTKKAFSEHEQSALENKLLSDESVVGNPRFLLVAQ
jgi:integrase